MKRKIYSLLTLLLSLVMSVTMLTACDKEEVTATAKAEIVSKTETSVVIKINETEDSLTLLDAMNFLKDEGGLSFEINEGMITSIEGKGNAADWSKCWMLYTSDSEMSNPEWGTITIDGKEYGSAIVGVDALEVVVGEVYIWSFDGL